MLMAKGHNPTPAISPNCVCVRLNCFPHAGRPTIDRSVNPNEVVTNATKHA